MNKKNNLIKQIVKTEIEIDKIAKAYNSNLKKIKKYQMKFDKNNKKFKALEYFVDKCNENDIENKPDENETLESKKKRMKNMLKKNKTLESIKKRMKNLNKKNTKLLSKIKDCYAKKELLNWEYNDLKEKYADLIEQRDLSVNEYINTKIEQNKKIQNKISYLENERADIRNKNKILVDRVFEFLKRYYVLDNNYKIFLSEYDDELLLKYKNTVESDYKFLSDNIPVMINYYTEIEYGFIEDTTADDIDEVFSPDDNFEGLKTKQDDGKKSNDSAMFLEELDNLTEQAKSLVSEFKELDTQRQSLYAIRNKHDKQAYHNNKKIKKKQKLLKKWQDFKLYLKRNLKYIIIITVLLIYNMYCFRDIFNSCKPIKKLNYTQYAESSDYENFVGYNYLLSKNKYYANYYADMYQALVEFYHSDKDYTQENNICYKSYYKDFNISTSEVGDIVLAFLEENPQLHWFVGSIDIGYDYSFIIYISDEFLTYSARQEMITELDNFYNEMNQIINNKGYNSELETVTVVFESIVNKIDYAYDENGIPDSSSHAHSIASIKYGYGVCEAYAELFKYYLNRFGIECECVDGTLGDSTGSHEWNCAKIDNEWYVFDLTNADGISLNLDKLNIKSVYFGMSYTNYEILSEGIELSFYSKCFQLATNKSLFSDEFLNYEYIPASKSIGIYCYNSNTNPESIIIPEKHGGLPVTFIDDYAFYNYSGKLITISSSITTIKDFAFAHCDAKILWDNPSIKTLSGFCFVYYGYTDFVLPDSVTSIEVGILLLSDVENIYYAGNIYQWNNIVGKSYLSSYTIYYYSETQPEQSGNYWHYDTDNITPVIWEQLQ